MVVRDEAGFTSLFEEHYESVLRYAWRRVGPADAPDIAAETFRIAWEKFDRVPADRPLPWLYITAKNLVLNLVRKDERRNGIATWLGPDLGNGVEADHAGAVAARIAAVAALNDLGERDRELVLLVSWEGLDLREAAAVAGCSRPTAAMRLHRARRRLRRLLGDQPEATVATRRPSYKETAV
ncbi:RNA polymerase sigma factor [Rhizohabitans arisaemae]|uniref:RNA polymerase sigma factor n=1 Tax=Rhizohabitans arisaemae TaxID=2720610 RepID=UPI0024B0CCE7|nr:RNA polymerase sigma factor [Rhizohabitans arisaemae]